MQQRRDRVEGGFARALFAFALLPILAAVLVASSPDTTVPDVRVRVLVLALCGPAWLVAVRLAHAGRGDLRLVIGGAVALRLLALAGDVRFSDDVYRYLWEGEVARSGFSAYAFAPDAPELEPLRRENPVLHARVNHPDVAASYPPLTQVAGLAAAVASRAMGSAPELGGVTLLRIFFAVCDLAVLWPIARMLSRAGRPPALVVVWGWSPLLAMEFSGSGHCDSLGVVLLMSALVLSVAPGRNAARELAAGALLAGAVLVKYLPLVVLPALMRDRRRARSWLATIVLCALAFAPFLLLTGGDRGFLGGLSQYGLRWESPNLVYRFLEAPFAGRFELDESWTDPRRLGRLCAAAVWLAFAIVTWVRRSDIVRATGVVIGAFLVLSPTLHPWYLAWIAPFVALRPSAAWCWLLAAAPLLYWPLAEWQLRGQWVEPAWLWPLLALPFFALSIHGWWSDARTAVAAHSPTSAAPRSRPRSPLDAT